jgi:hypothetical protein
MPNNCLRRRADPVLRNNSALPSMGADRVNCSISEQQVSQMSQLLEALSSLISSTAPEGTCAIALLKCLDRIYGAGVERSPVTSCFTIRTSIMFGVNGGILAPVNSDWSGTIRRPVLHRLVGLAGGDGSFPKATTPPVSHSEFRRRCRSIEMVQRTGLPEFAGFLQ